MKKLYFEPYMHASSGGRNDGDRCAMCGEAGKGHYKALVVSEEDARKVVRMFENLGLFAKVVAHDSEAPDVSFSRCQRHYLQVHAFQEAHRGTKIISYRSLAEYLVR